MHDVSEEREKLELFQVSSLDEWKTYHAIRRAELFEHRGRYDYDPDHPSERAPNKYSLLFKVGGKAIGTVRLDILDSRRAAVRLVAISKSEQGKGFGRLLMDYLETFAKKKGISKLMLNATKTSAGFYEHVGFQKESWSDSEIARFETERIQMSKFIS